MCKTGIFNWFGYIMPIEERLILIKEAGFDSVMLWWENEDIPKFIDKSCFVNLAKQYDLEIDNIHLPYEYSNTFWSENTTDRENYIHEVMTWFEGCKISGCDKVVLHTSRSSLKSYDYSIGYKSFEKLVRLAEDIKLKVAVENTQVYHTTEFVLKEFKSDYIGLCYDSSHDFINGQSKGELLKRWKDRLFCVHLSDTDGLEDRHWLIGKGNIDFKPIIDIIKQTNCQSFSMEVYPHENEKQLNPIEFLKKAKLTIKKIID